MLVILLIVLLATGESLAATIRGRVDFGDLPPQPLLVRTNTNHHAFVRSDGSFYLRNIESGHHELMVVDSLRYFSKAIVQVSADGQTSRLVEVLPSQKQAGGPPVHRETSSLVLRPILLIDYFEKRQEMTVMSLIANPMMLMMIATLCLGLAMPKMMENMDPEELKKMQEQMAQSKTSSDPSKAFASLMGGNVEESDSDSD